jgi:hypothetical protein
LAAAAAGAVRRWAGPGHKHVGKVTAAIDRGAVRYRPYTCHSPLAGMQAHTLPDTNSSGGAWGTAAARDHNCTSYVFMKSCTKSLKCM